jgi:hydrogenase-4 component B
MAWPLLGLLLAVGVLLAGGFLALLTTRLPRLCTVLGIGGAVAGSALGLFPVLVVLIRHETVALSVPWLTVAGGAFSIELDSLSAFFVVPVLVLTALAAVYGGPYWLGHGSEHSHRPLGPAWFWYNLLTVSMVMVALARNGVLFLVVWEVMAVSSYFLVIFEDEKEDVCQAGWVYLVATHLSVTFLFVLFVLLGHQLPSTEYSSPALEFSAFAQASYPIGLRNVIFLLALVGFGTKAGLVPLHVWLPEAHPAAPSHVSAVLSGVMIKMGLYGILRVVLLLGGPLYWWGPLLMGIGLAGGLIGISLALSQRDLKRALAYSSVENVGLITLGLGIGLWGWATGRPAVAVLGLGGGLLHVWNHAMMKGVMFLSAGSVLHSTGTKDIEQLGGILKRMPRTGTLMIVGAVAIAGLPPLNGFVSEWLLYLGLLEGGLRSTGSAALACLLTVSGLALVGGLAAICFVRLTGIALLGEPRSDNARHAHESPPGMTWPMGVLLLLCLILAIFPGLFFRVLAGPIGQVLGRQPDETLALLNTTGVSLTTLGLFNAAVCLVLLMGATAFILLTRRNGVVNDGTWGCGYVQPTPRIQYTGESFAEMVAGGLLPHLLRPHNRVAPPQGLFPAPGSFSSSHPEPLQERVYEPFFRRWADRCNRLWWLQHGKVTLYILYLMVLVMLGLAWVSLRSGGVL